MSYIHRWRMPTSPTVQIWDFICWGWSPTITEVWEACRNNRNTPSSPGLSPQNLGWSGNSKIPDRLGFSRQMKTRLKWRYWRGKVNTPKIYRLYSSTVVYSNSIKLLITAAWIPHILSNCTLVRKHKNLTQWLIKKKEKKRQAMWECWLTFQYRV